MSYDYVQYASVYLIFIIIDLFVATVSLKHYVIKYKSTREQIIVFLEGLSKPLKPFFSVKPQYNIFDYVEISDLPEYLVESKYHLLGRLISTIMPLIIIFMNMALLLRVEDVSQLIFQSVFLCINCYCFYRAWRFGHKLKDIKVSES